MELRWDRLNWKDLQKLRESGYAGVVLPVGTIEAHGIIPLGTDNIIPENIARRVAPDLSLLVAPTVSYGITRSLLDYPGSLTVSSATFKTYVKEIMLSLAEAGMKKVVVMNGHGGHFDELREAATEVHRQTRMKIVVVHWWVLCESLVEKHFGTPGGHAAVDETAAVIACAPDTVNQKAYDKDMLYYARPGVNVFPAPSTILVYNEGTGALDFDARKANAYFDDVCHTIKDFLVEVFRRWGE